MELCECANRVPKCTQLHIKNKKKGEITEENWKLAEANIKLIVEPLIKCYSNRIPKPQIHLTEILTSANMSDCLFHGSDQMLTEWACFLHKGLSFLEKNGWPSRLVEQTCEERDKHVQSNSHSTGRIHLYNRFTICCRVKNVSCTYRAHKTGVVPSEAKSLQKLVPSLDREVTAVAVSPKQVVVVWVHSVKCYSLRINGKKSLYC